MSASGPLRTFVDAAANGRFEPKQPRHNCPFSICSITLNLTAGQDMPVSFIQYLGVPFLLLVHSLMPAILADMEHVQLAGASGSSC
jgi:hypothetical protein